ncbi:DEAD/DEAH box helicase family protein [Lederbergia sp. NSJ-179]|uniref:DEAD/DEAH box helicase family protein n=1 Tax=Lederbergia sp. NSJ-179 TaxID=2931402 RepID=UPI001FCFE28D|nr:DEAD/DEAH box helicase family protein [Lederbergia sp. NSJ-179]MCJ7839435.1 DEAD/DEAH box helicase family protein [Lederbergia sp. NSJ-179]
MMSFPENIRFCYEWRSYQARILDELDRHLSNKHLHLVAPPGSGKTVLGLEVMLRLNKPTLIVAPTVAIRNQWAERFVELFLQSRERPDWVSMDIYQPAFVTITTYQALHSFFSKKVGEEIGEEGGDDGGENELKNASETKDEAITRLKSYPFGTFILDEAHHLRTAWWQSTIDFRDHLGEPAIVALTATPPYDTGLHEWEKYMKLCGPIDAEITVSELVREQELCPHQDYIYFSAPSTKEAAPIKIFHQAVSNFRHKMVQNQAFIKQLENHPWITATSSYITEILSRPAFYSSMLIFLKEVESEEWNTSLQTLYPGKKNLPSLTLEWLEELLTGVLFQDEYFQEGEERNKLYNDLSRMGAIERRKVLLRSTTAMKQSLIRSTSKLTSINQIVSFEANQLQENLRLVILADYIHLQDLPKQAGDEKPIMRLGVIPIFEHLRREYGNDLRLGVLTGSVVILSISSLSILEKHAKRQGLDYSTQVLPHDPQYTMIKWATTSRQRMVSVMTNVFSEGGIQCLVGTTALLGEGWDAPSINALIIASYVGTFMLSNQMRGRAIRTEKGNPDKTANIWHLVCVDFEEQDGGHDFLSLTRRFRSLMGLHATKDKICTGIERMQLLPPPFSQEGIKRENERMFQRAKKNELFARWQKAVEIGSEKKEVMSADQKSIPRPFVFQNTLKSMIVIGFMIFVQVFYSALEEPSKTGDVDMRARVVLGLGLGVIFSFPYLYKAAKGFLRNPTIEKNMVQVGEVVYQTLYQIGLVKTKLKHNQIYAEKNGIGFITCWIETGTTHEQKIFLQALQELMDPIENPKYLLFRQSGKRWFKRQDYHAIPEEIGRKKEYVDFFLKEWQKRIGKAEIIYTRTPEGRRSLLTARMKAMSAIFVKKSERISEWR